MRGNLVWGICAFVHTGSKAGLLKEVVFHEGGLSKQYHCIYNICSN